MVRQQPPSTDRKPAAIASNAAERSTTNSPSWTRTNCAACWNGFESLEFLSDYGIRSLSKYHELHPFVFGHSEVRYDPASPTTRSKAAIPTGVARSGFRQRS